MKIIDDHHVADIRSAVNQEVDFIGSLTVSVSLLR